MCGGRSAPGRVHVARLQNAIRKQDTNSGGTMASSFKPNFNKYHDGPWPYRSEQGVGLELSGSPTDSHLFLDTTQGFGCNPVAAHRILNILRRGETKRTT